MAVLEKTYIFLFKNALRAVNPVKKRIVRTECRVHKFINNQAVVILKNDGRDEAYKFMSAHINALNGGVVWADQDLKSSNHFYNPDTKRGLYGNSNAKKECRTYYKKALKEYFQGHTRRAMFYLGAACHLIQDLTVPQHANVRLLNNHRSYEKWVINTHKHHDEFRVDHGGIYLDSLKFYIELNSRKAIHTYERYSLIRDRYRRFYKITSIILTMAQRTTAGLLYKFYYDTHIINLYQVRKKSTRLRLFK